MTVRKLLKILLDHDLDLKTLKSSDDEGNYFYHLEEVIPGSYVGNGRDIEVGVHELTDELKAQGCTEDDVKKHPCLVLY